MLFTVLGEPGVKGYGITSRTPFNLPVKKQYDGDLSDFQVTIEPLHLADNNGIDPSIFLPDASIFLSILVPLENTTALLHYTLGRISNKIAKEIEVSGVNNEYFILEERRILTYKGYGLSNSAEVHLIKPNKYPEWSNKYYGGNTSPYQYPIDFEIQGNLPDGVLADYNPYSQQFFIEGIGSVSLKDLYDARNSISVAKINYASNIFWWKVTLYNKKENDEITKFRVYQTSAPTYLIEPEEQKECPNNTCGVLCSNNQVCCYGANGIAVDTFFLN